MIVNLTPHAINIYSQDTPQVASEAELAAGLIATIPPSGQVARLATADLGNDPTVDVDGVPIDVGLVQYGTLDGLPKRQEGVWFVVSLVCALASRRADLLMSDAQVRNEANTVVGCKRLGRVVQAEAPTAPHDYDYPHKDPRGILRGEKWEDLLDGQFVSVLPPDMATPFGTVTIRVGQEMADLHTEVAHEFHQALGYARRRAGAQQCPLCPEYGEPLAAESPMWQCLNGHVFDVETAIQQLRPCKPCGGYGTT